MTKPIKGNLPPKPPTPETKVLSCGSQNHHKIFRICQVCDQICDCCKFWANLPFVVDKKPLFAGISHFSLPQNLNLHRICGDQKSNHKLDICRRLHEGFVSCTKGPLFPVPSGHVFGLFCTCKYLLPPDEHISSSNNPFWAGKCLKIHQCHRSLGPLSNCLTDPMCHGHTVVSN